MTDPGYTAILLLIDRSGSMRAILDATQDSINEYVAAQRDRPGRTTIRIVQFDAAQGGVEDWYLEHCPSTPADQVPPFELRPRGMTAIYDALGRAIDEFGAELGALPEPQRPSTVIFAVMTDGRENSSIEETAATVKARVSHQINTYRWHVLYLGANQDAILEAAKVGVPTASAITYDATDRGTRSVLDSANTYTASAVAGERAGFTEAQRRAARRRR